MQRTIVIGFGLLVASFRTGDTEIFRVDPVTGDSRNLTRSPQSSERYPSWSPDGSLIAFNSDRDGTHNLFLMDGDGRDEIVASFADEPAAFGAGPNRCPSGGGITAWKAVVNR